MFTNSLQVSSHLAARRSYVTWMHESAPLANVGLAVITTRTGTIPKPKAPLRATSVENSKWCRYSLTMPPSVTYSSKINTALNALASVRDGSLQQQTK